MSFLSYNTRKKTQVNFLKVAIIKIPLLSHYGSSIIYLTIRSFKRVYFQIRSKHRKILVMQNT